MSRSPIVRLVVPAKNKTYEPNSWGLFLKYFWMWWNKEPLELYISVNDQWKLAGRRGIYEECVCGSDFTTEYGEEFKRILPNSKLTGMDMIIDIFHAHPLCEQCFYYREWSNPRVRHLVPKKWQDTFAQNP